MVVVKGLLHDFATIAPLPLKIVPLVGAMPPTLRTTVLESRASSVSFLQKLNAFQKTGQL